MIKYEEVLYVSSAIHYSHKFMCFFYKYLFRFKNIYEVSDLALWKPFKLILLPVYVIEKQEYIYLYQ